MGFSSGKKLGNKPFLLPPWHCVSHSKRPALEARAVFRIIQEIIKPFCCTHLSSHYFLPGFRKRWKQIKNKRHPPANHASCPGIAMGGMGVCTPGGESLSFGLIGRVLQNFTPHKKRTTSMPVQQQQQQARLTAAGIWTTLKRPTQGRKYTVAHKNRISKHSEQ